jgi:predicted dehydrogenase
VIRVALVGLGKMGLSHCAVLNAHPGVEVVGICDSSTLALSALGRYTRIPTYSDFDHLLETAEMDALVISTPSRTHAHLVRQSLNRGLSVFCEKPFTLRAQDADELTALAREQGLVTQVGYHNRFVAAFSEAKRLLDLNAIGELSHCVAEAYGPVVLRAKGGTWRSSKSEGGGCLYDYAAHAINLVNWYMGEPSAAGGTALKRVFSREIDDEVASTLHFGDDSTAQISANWSDESQRKMTTRLTLWGTTGRIYVDRQECQVYLRDTAAAPPGYAHGWNVRYTTDLTPPVWFYLRGEEYSAQLDKFIARVADGEVAGPNDFESARQTDRSIEMMLADAELSRRPDERTLPRRRARRRSRTLWTRRAIQREA